jgi:FtsZ-interacting cell division protein ZipA
MPREWFWVALGFLGAVMVIVSGVVALLFVTHGFWCRRRQRRALVRLEVSRQRDAERRARMEREASMRLHSTAARRVRREPHGTRPTRM